MTIQVFFLLKKFMITIWLYEDSLQIFFRHINHSDRPEKAIRLKNFCHRIWFSKGSVLKISNLKFFLFKKISSINVALFVFNLLFPATFNKDISFTLAISPLLSLQNRSYLNKSVERLWASYFKSFKGEKSKFTLSKGLEEISFENLREVCLEKELNVFVIGDHSKFLIRQLIKMS